MSDYWKAGERVSARKLNRMVDAIGRMNPLGRSEDIAAGRGIDLPFVIPVVVRTIQTVPHPHLTIAKVHWSGPPTTTLAKFANPDQQDRGYPWGNASVNDFTFYLAPTGPTVTATTTIFPAFLIGQYHFVLLLPMETAVAAPSAGQLAPPCT